MQLKELEAAFKSVNEALKEAEASLDSVPDLPSSELPRQVTFDVCLYASDISAEILQTLIAAFNKRVDDQSFKITVKPAMVKQIYLSMFLPCFCS